MYLERERERGRLRLRGWMDGRQKFSRKAKAERATSAKKGTEISLVEIKRLHSSSVIC